MCHLDTGAAALGYGDLGLRQEIHRYELYAAGKNVKVSFRIRVKLRAAERRQDAIQEGVSPDHTPDSHPHRRVRRYPVGSHQWCTAWRTA